MATALPDSTTVADGSAVALSELLPPPPHAASSPASAVLESQQKEPGRRLVG